jgi:Tol biopolymer transport system component
MNCKSIVVLIVVVVLLGGCAKKDSSTHRNTPQQFRIIYESAQDAPLDDSDFKAHPQEYMELYTKNMDGSDIRRITYNTLWEHQADVSPDGERIVCSIHYSPGRVTETDPGWEIAVMDIDGSTITRLTDNDYLDFGAHWNHDGTKIVYVSDSAHRSSLDIENSALPQYDIYVMNADGSNKTRVTFSSPGDVNADPSFSFIEPSKILYIHSEGFSGNFDLYMMDADGSEKTLVFEHTDEILAIHDPMFSPDGTRVIFEAKIREDSHKNPIYNLFSISADGSDLQQITQDDGESDIMPKYSPDGKKICYFTYKWKNGDHTTEIRVANSDGSDETVISDFPWEEHPGWVPNSEGSPAFCSNLLIVVKENEQISNANLIQVKNPADRFHGFLAEFEGLF